jgi:hypothetical protein
MIDPIDGGSKARVHLHRAVAGKRRPRGRALLAALVLTGLLGGAGWVWAAGEEAEPSTRLVASPLRLLAGLEEGWRKGDSETVLGCLSGEPVELALGRTGPPGGRFTRTQVEYLIRDLLHYGKTLDFKIVQFEWEDGEPPEAVAEWEHRMATGTMHDELEIELAREGESWRVVRIATR